MDYNCFLLSAFPVWIFIPIMGWCYILVYYGATCRPDFSLGSGTFTSINMVKTHPLSQLYSTTHDQLQKFTGRSQDCISFKRTHYEPSFIYRPVGNQRQLGVSVSEDYTLPWTGDLFRVYPASRLMTAGIVSSIPATLNGLGGIENEWMTESSWSLWPEKCTKPGNTLE